MLSSPPYTAEVTNAWSYTSTPSFTSYAQFKRTELNEHIK